jgi:hypothetical protein
MNPQSTGEVTLYSADPSVSSLPCFMSYELLVLLGRSLELKHLAKLCPNPRVDTSEHH